MKKSLLIAAGLLTFGISAALTPKVNANGTFNVVAGQPGTISFTGSGTAQFNNSLGTNNSFQVGSSTNLGVNANVSSTNGYGVGSTADLQLAGSSQLQQVIGTSGTTSERIDTQAHEAASEYMSSWEVEFGVKADYASNGYASEREWQVAYDREYNSQYSSARESSQATASSNASSGTISGSFKTIEAGTAQASGNASDWGTAAESAAIVEVGAKADYAASGYESEAAWQSAYDQSYNAAYANASAASNRYSDSTVVVNGIGSDANVYVEGGSGETQGSNFNVDIGVLTTVNDNGDTISASTSSTDTASGSAGASLATSSFANQSTSSTASGFLQAFGAGS